MTDNPNDSQNDQSQGHPLSCLIGYGIAVVLFAAFAAMMILAIDGGGH